MDIATPKALIHREDTVRIALRLHPGGVWCPHTVTDLLAKTAVTRSARPLQSHVFYPQHPRSWLLVPPCQVQGLVDVYILFGRYSKRKIAL